MIYKMKPSKLIEFVKQAWRNTTNRPIILNCYTFQPDIFREAKPQKATKFFPNWWKELPLEIDTHVGSISSTMRRCVGFVDFYKQSVVMPLWTDVIFIVAPKGIDMINWQFADKGSGADVHPPEQRGRHLPADQYAHVKMLSPWLFTCDEDINFVFTGAVWNQEKPEDMMVMPGIMNFKYQETSNVNVFFPRKDEQTKVRLTMGTPLVQLIPMNARPVLLKHHLITKDEWDSKNNVSSLTFTNLYQRSKKALDELGPKQCPFSSVKK